MVDIMGMDRDMKLTDMRQLLKILLCTMEAMQLDMVGTHMSNSSRNHCNHNNRGVGAVEFIIGHAEVTIVFVEEEKISEVLKTFPKAGKYLKNDVYANAIQSDSNI